MKEQEQTNSTKKKEWQKPDLEIISKDNIRSGISSFYAEGVKTIAGFASGSVGS